MKALKWIVLLTVFGICSSSFGQKDIKHILTLKSGASFKVSVLEITDSTLTYLSGDHRGTTKLSDLKSIKYISTGYTDRPYSLKYSNGSHLLELRSGSSFSIYIIEMNDSILKYSSGGLEGSVAPLDLKKVKIKQYPSTNSNGILNPNSTFRLKNRVKDTTEVFKNSGLTGFVDFGSNCGIIEEDQWSYPIISYYIEGGFYMPKGKNVMLGASLGLHPFIIYNAATMPIKLRAKYVFTPQKRRSIAANVGLGYGLQIADQNPLKSGGICYNYGLSFAKTKNPNRVNEWNFGFLVDRFESIRNIGRWDPNTQIFTNTEVQQFATARRFYISKRWWFK